MRLELIEGFIPKIILQHWVSFVLLLAFAVVIGVPLYHGLTHHFLDNADPDVDLAYMALVFNSERQIPFNNFTAYGQVLMLGPWLDVAHWLGLIPVSTIDPLIGSTDFETLFAPVIYAGRALSILLSCLLIAALWLLLRLAVRDSTVAALGVLLMASSQGLSKQFVLMRPELPAMLFVMCAAAALIYAVRASGWAAIMALAIAGFAAMFAVMAKVQAVFLVLPLPLMAFIFLPDDKRLEKTPKPFAIYSFAVLSLVISIPALVTFGKALLAGKTLSYQTIIAVYLIGCFAFYSYLRIRSAYWTLASICGVLVGSSAALHLVQISDHWWTPYAIANFVDFMSFDANVRVAKGGWGFVGYLSGLFGFFFEHVQDVFFSNRLQNKDYWFQLIYWASPIFILASLVVKQYRTALQAIYFLAIALGLVTVFSVRSYHFYYMVFVEPWVIASAAVGAAGLLRSIERKRFAIMVMTAVVVSVSFVDLRYHLIAPSTAKTRNFTHVCCYLNYAELIRPQLKPYCEQGIRELGGVSALCMHDAFPNRMRYFLQSQPIQKP